MCVMKLLLIMINDNIINNSNNDINDINDNIINESNNERNINNNMN